MTATSAWARCEARRLLASRPDRLAHTAGVAAAATHAALIRAPAERDLAAAAAWAHDLGYGTPIAASGFHPLDGARHITTATGDARLADLVAHHTGARHEAAVRGLTADLAAHADERSEVSDPLAWADLTTSPTGQPITVDSRLADMARRYGPDHPVTAAITAATPELLAAVERTTRRLHGAGVAARTPTAVHLDPNTSSLKVIGVNTPTGSGGDKVMGPGWADRNWRTWKIENIRRSLA
jgi:hypothetical protein